MDSTSKTKLYPLNVTKCAFLGSLALLTVQHAYHPYCTRPLRWDRGKLQQSVGAYPSGVFALRSVVSCGCLLPALGVARAAASLCGARSARRPGTV